HCARLAFTHASGPPSRAKEVKRSLWEDTAMSTKVLFEALRRGLLATGEAMTTRQAIFRKRQIAARGGRVGPSAEGKAFRSGLAVLCALGVVVGHAAISRADNVCNGFINFEILPPPAHNVGDKVTVKLSLGAGTITGGPMNILTITSLL